MYDVEVEVQTCTTTSCASSFQKYSLKAIEYHTSSLCTYSEEVVLQDDNQAPVLDDLGSNADLYIANQEVVHD